MLFTVADFLSRPPGFYIVLVAMVVCTALVPLGLTDVVTYALSVLAIVITGVVLIQGYRDTAAIHAKLDEIVIALRETRNDVVGLEHADPKEIKEVVETLEREAEELVGAGEGRPPSLAGGTERVHPVTMAMPARSTSPAAKGKFRSHFFTPLGCDAHTAPRFPKKAN